MAVPLGVTSRLIPSTLLFALAACSGGAAGMPDTLVGSSDPATGPADAQPVAAPPIATVGEQMTMQVSLHGLNLAQMVVDVTGVVAVGGRDALVIEARVDTQALAQLVSPVHDRYTTWLDVGTGRPLQFRAIEAATPDAKAQEQTEASFTGSSYPVRLVVGGGAGTEETQVVHGTPFDFAAFLFFMRGWEAAEGSELTTDVMRSRFVWRVRSVVAGHGNLKTALGDLPVVRFEGEAVRLLRDGEVDPKSDRRRFTIWISDDADRVPVKLAAHTDYGDVLLEVARYTSGNAP